MEHSFRTLILRMCVIPRHRGGFLHCLPFRKCSLLVTFPSPFCALLWWSCCILCCHCILLNMHQHNLHNDTIHKLAIILKSCISVIHNIAYFMSKLVTFVTVSRCNFHTFMSQSAKNLLMTAGQFQPAVWQEKWLDDYEMARMWKWFYSVVWYFWVFYLIEVGKSQLKKLVSCQRSKSEICGMWNRSLTYILCHLLFSEGRMKLKIVTECSLLCWLVTLNPSHVIFGSWCCWYLISTL